MEIYSVREYSLFAMNHERATRIFFFFFFFFDKFIISYIRMLLYYLFKKYIYVSVIPIRMMTHLHIQIHNAIQYFLRITDWIMRVILKD